MHGFLLILLALEYASIFASPAECLFREIDTDALFYILLYTVVFNV
jgi:hypothetical protein